MLPAVGMFSDVHCLFQDGKGTVTQILFSFKNGPIGCIDLLNNIDFPKK